MLLSDFKSQHGVAKLTVNKGKGRMYSDVVTKSGAIQRIFFSKDADISKPLYVNEGVHGALWVGNNTGATVVREI